jgi:cellulose synthase/poly-beta-1,6-N-acetylglucosamine synthase-like glycosyltransferase
VEFQVNQQITDMIATLVHIFFQLLFAYFSINILYLLVAAVAGRVPKRVVSSPSADLKRIAILITSLKEDEVIINTVRSAVSHDYDPGFFQVFVAADQLKSPKFCDNWAQRSTKCISKEDQKRGRLTFY